MEAAEEENATLDGAGALRLEIAKRIMHVSKGVVELMGTAAPLARPTDPLASILRRVLIFAALLRVCATACSCYIVRVTACRPAPLRVFESTIHPLLSSALSRRMNRRQ